MAPEEMPVTHKRLEVLFKAFNKVWHEGLTNKAH